jgi:hypothetical protein
VQSARQRTAQQSRSSADDHSHHITDLPHQQCNAFYFCTPKVAVMRVVRKPRSSVTVRV